MNCISMAANRITSAAIQYGILAISSSGSSSTKGKIKDNNEWKLVVEGVEDI